MNINLKHQIVLNNPRVFWRMVGNIHQSVSIECGDGWYALIDGLGYDLTALARQTDITIFVSRISSCLGAMRVRWETANELLPVEHQAIVDLLLRYSVASRSVCEVCARPLTPINLLNPRCEDHADDL